MARRPRLESIDLLRGLVMALMALDHTRDYFGDIRLSPENLATTTLPLFLTRWITHFCAPVFVFLAGSSAWLYGSATGRRRADLSRFLFTRGLWLVLLEFTVVKFGWVHSFTAPGWTLQVIAALGAGMIALAFLSWLPRGVLLCLGLVLVAGRGALSAPDFATASNPSEALRLIALDGGFGIPLSALSAELANAGVLRVFYPLLPWLGVMLLGFVTAPVFRAEPAARKRALLGLGAGATALFVLLRTLGSYGDPSVYAAQDTASRSVIAFLNCAKYPPSLQYLLMTLGPALLFLGLAENARGAVVKSFVALGRVPLFFYVLHIHLIHLAARTLYAVEFGEFFSPLQAVFSGGAFPRGFGHGLGVVYLAWLLCLAVLWWPCMAFARLKERKRSAWLSYL